MPDQAPIRGFSMSDHYVRAKLVKSQVDRLVAEAKFCTDPERLRAINAEVDLLTENVRQIYEEQLREQLDPPKVERRPWWRFW